MTSFLNYQNRPNTFTCSSCQKIRDISQLKASYKNNVELQKIKTETDNLTNALLKLDDMRTQAEQVADKKRIEQIKEVRQKYSTRLKQAWERVKNFGGTLLCENCYSRATHQAQQRRGDVVEFQCKSCGQSVQGKRYHGHFTNLAGVNPDLRVSVCKSCWLDKVMPNDKIQYCP
jgi:RNase P subunit RPR2